MILDDGRIEKVRRQGALEGKYMKILSLISVGLCAALAGTTKIVQGVCADLCAQLGGVARARSTAVSK